MIIRDIEAYSYVKWKHRKASPINEEILNTWTQRKKQRDWEHGGGKLFHICFKQWQKGKVTPINDKTRFRFQAVQFRESTLKEYDISKYNHRYSIHHPLPKCYFPDRAFDIYNTLPLIKSVHNECHKRYNNKQLLVDPISPVIEVLEELVFCSK